VSSSFIGLLVIFNSVAGWIWTHCLKTFPSPFLRRPFPTTNPVRPTKSERMLITLVELVALYVFFRFTSLGLAMRAAAFNPVSARLVGIRSAGCWRSMGARRGHRRRRRHDGRARGLSRPDMMPESCSTACRRAARRHRQSGRRAWSGFHRSVSPRTCSAPT
jgi:hypothetical protein